MYKVGFHTIYPVSIEKSYMLLNVSCTLQDPSTLFLPDYTSK